MITIGRQKQLFVDDYIIEQMDGVTQVLHEATKHPDNPLIVADQPWELTPHPQIFMYGSVIYDKDEKLFKMWYESYGQNAGCYATSQDGLHWDKPTLNLVEVDGSKQNNCVNWRALGMIHCPQDPDPARHYKSIGGMDEVKAPAGQRGAFSPDGLHWSVPADSEDIPGDVASDCVIPFCYDELSGRYVAFPKVIRKSGKHDRRSVSVSFSDDFLTWTPVQTILVPDERDDELARERVPAMRDHIEFDDGPDWHIAQLYGLCGFPYEGMYLGMLWVFDISGWGSPILEKRKEANKPGRKPGEGGEDGIATSVQLVCSRDLLNWDRVADRKLLITAGEVGSFDAGRLYTTNRPIIVDDEIWIYYGAFQTSHGKHTDQWNAEHRGSGIGLAKLRLDGWVSVDADNEPGTLTTKPLTFTGTTLQINAAVEKDGEVCVEILDEAEQPVAGFSLSDCQPFKGDSVRHQVQWQHNSNLSHLENTLVRLRFYLNKAKLYSFVFR